MRSLRGRLLALWFMLVASAMATGFLLVASFRQSASAQIGRAEEVAARSCREIADRYGFFSAGWRGPAAPDFDDELRRQLTAVVQTALAREPGVEGGIWQTQAGSLAYAFPTYEGTGPKTDLPVAELAAIRDINAEAAADERPVTVRKVGRSQILVLHACPLQGPLSALTGWTLTRVFTESGESYNRLLIGLGILALTVLGSAAWLGRLLFGWSRRLGHLEAALASHNVEDMPHLEPTGERELDRLVDALNAARARLGVAREQATAAERLAAVGRLAAGIAHEIRNPIAAMRLRAENALATRDEVRRETALSAILGQIGRLDVLLSDLLATTHRREPVLQRVDVASFLAGIGDSHGELARERRIVITNDVVEPDAATAAFDPEQVHRAIDNLLLNALQNTPAGGSVRLAAAREDGRLLLRVSDTGDGVPEALRDRLFEPFVTGRAEGTGLGLAIVREIARAHGGEARFRAFSGGSLFELELPWRPS